MVTASLVDQKRSYYTTALGLTDQVASAMSITDLETLFFSGSSGSIGGGVSAVGRTVTKMLDGQNVTISWVGDSGVEGTTVNSVQDFNGNPVASGVLGTDDIASVVTSSLAAKYGVVVTKQNWAKSGFTVAAAFRDNYAVGAPNNKAPFTLALADKADCYVLSFGHNDIRSMSNTPGTGYPLAAAMGGVEHMIRRIRRDVPFADIVLLAEWPYNNSAVLSNSNLTLFNRSLRTLASAYGCEFVDGYAAFTATGNVEHYISATNHPTSEGHHLWAQAMLARFPSSYTSLSPASLLPEITLYGAERYTRNAWSLLTVGQRNYGHSSWYTSGTGWSVANGNPTTSSTVGDQVRLLFLGTECTLNIDVGAGQGVVSIAIDNSFTIPTTITGASGTVNLSNFDLSTVGVTGQYVLPITGLDPGIHSIYITIISGSLTWRGAGCQNGAVEWFDATSGRVTFTGAWTPNAGGFLSQWTGYNTTSSAITDSVAFDFVGTGCGMHLQRLANVGHQLSVAIDGGAPFNVDVGGANTSGNPGWLTLVKGLTYGHHSITVTNTASVGATNFQWGAVGIFDERRTARPRKQRSIAKVGETVNFAASYSDKPAVTTYAADNNSAITPSATKTAATATIAGTAGALVGLDIEGDLVAF